MNSTPDDRSQEPRPPHATDQAPRETDAGDQGVKAFGEKPWGKRLWQRIRQQRLWRYLSDVNQPPFVAQYELTGDVSSLEKVSAKAFPGLLSWQVISSNDGGRRLQTIWQSADWHAAARKRFESRLAPVLRCPPVFEGYQDRLYAKVNRGKTRPLLRFGWFLYTAAATLMAILGWAAALRTHYEFYFAEPEVQLVAESKVFQGVVDEPFELHLPFRNTAFSGGSAMRVKAIRFTTRDDATTEDIEPEEFVGQVIVLPSPGSTGTVTVRGTPRKKGKFKVVVDAAIKAGRWKAEKATAFPYELEFWHEIDHDQATIVSSDPGQCRLLVPLHFGRPFPQGIEGTTLVKGAKIIYIQSTLSIRHFSDPTYSPLDGHDQAPSKADWTLGPILQPEDAQLLVQLKDESGTGRTPAQWERIAKDMYLHMVPAQ